MANTSESVSIRISKPVSQRLGMASEALDKSKAELIEAAVTEYLDKLNIAYPDALIVKSK